MKNTPEITGFKGFDKNLKCRGHQFNVGETHKHDGEVVACNSGFHFCEHPLDVFAYYPPGESRFASVRGGGEIDRKGTDTKVACSSLHIEAEVDFSAMVTAAVKFVFDRAKWTKKNTATEESEGVIEARPRGAASATGYSGAASATGYSGAASATGDRGAASATGDRGAASATGKHGIAAAFGIDGRAKGALGVWIVVSEWKRDENDAWYRDTVKTALVDGKKIKADTFYKLTDGKFVEA
jgi:hypothetical protein